MRKVSLFTLGFVLIGGCASSTWQAETPVGRSACSADDMLRRTSCAPTP